MITFTSNCFGELGREYNSSQKTESTDNRHMKNPWNLLLWSE
jgi:hypothetical protein